ncbi:ParB/RepB/Spo0J family partition protein [Terrihabitans rhizophilus]|uniref:ParB/RepB/Spo0J family partition protein n=1 Tax=Terrihabitans rhizophilus TaxID=3092662 RepID=A0ABU4RRR4_9HYPH|nr:ParB/RepB/Spo0J family partition protein [Terrihabitans sp. PJ23]MDX6807539.1 ParB/RepB/Spo0J family partition protein [Terrihabitans sp. PJ23]
MAEDVIRPRLGRGLAALIGDVGEDERLSERPRNGQRRAPVEFLRANPRNPRKAFTEAELEDLVNSVREKGVVQPILVRSAPGQQGSFEIIAGERRWRAAQRAGLHEVPIVVLEVSDREALELAIIENVQRADLNAIEEAAGYESLVASHGYTQNDLAKIIGKSRSHIANTMRLMKLPEDVREKVRQGALSAGHARALLGLDDPSSAARRIVDEGLTVRDAEAMAQGATSSLRGRKAAVGKDADTAALEKQLSDLLGMDVIIDHKGERGQIQIRYASLDQLDELCRRLKG